ncbi:hypothetical protein [Bacillus haynesii]|uniref:hypothetical protein n=1 Tax=Bacillus haynesii TaxID=1925021 RepID=UPI00227F1733|nr:hypothetical protein [Bacillus haynesii]MCY8225226.1 hypothetical protein [Bacillus haynesii]
MNFETKHLIRWGIPGWTYLGLISIYFYIKESALNNAFSLEQIPFVPITAIFFGSGIIVGYLIHQLSMLFGFVILNKWDKYFEREFNFDQIIMTDEKRGNEIQRIYSYRLGNVHALRALFFSLVIALLTITILCFVMYFSIKVFCFICIIFLLAVMTFINFRYFHENLHFFMRKVEEDHSENDQS